MTLLVEWGAIFLAYSTPLSLFWFFGRKSPKLVIMMVTGAFMWLMGALVSSIVWVAVVPLKQDPWFMVVVSVPIQELFRWLYWKMLKKAEGGLNTLASDDNMDITRDRVALISGLGQGLIAGTLPLSVVLPELAGPSSIPSLPCPSLSFGMVQAIIAAVIMLLQTFWNIAAADAWEKRANRRGGMHFDDWRIVFVVVAHYAFSLVTLNNNSEGPCAGTMVPIFMLLFVSAGIAYTTAGMQRVGKNGDRGL